MKYLFEICVICFLGLLSSHQTDCESWHFQTKLHSVYKQAKQRRSIEGSTDSTSRIETDTGSAQERKRHSSENRQDHFALLKADLIKQVKRLNTSGNVLRGHKVPEIVAVVLSRLNIEERISRLQLPAGCIFNATTLYHKATEEIIKRTFDRPLDNTTMSDYLLTDAYFLKFCRVLLTFGLYLKNFKQILCPHTHSQIHFQPRYKFWLEDNNSEQVSISDMEREKQLYSELQKHYRRFEVPSFRGDWLPYQVEAYANRLLCISNSLLDKIFEGKDIEKEHVTQLKLGNYVIYILKGYSFIDDNSTCPMAFMQNLFRQYSKRGHKYLTDAEFKSFYDDAISLRIKNNFQVSTNANKDENKGHLWNGNTSIPVISVREHGIRNKNVHPNDHDFHGGEHRPPGGLHHGLLPTCSYHMLRFPHSQNDYNDHICNKQPSFLNPGHNYHLPERKCFSAEELLELFSENNIEKYNRSFSSKQSSSDHHSQGSRSVVTMAMFEDLCPAMMQQILSGECNSRILDMSSVAPALSNSSTAKWGGNQSTTHHNGTITTGQLVTWQRYVYGSLSILVISLCSLLGAVFIKVAKAAVKNYMMATMLSLAVGCLISDVALHLLPQVISEVHDPEYREGGLPDYIIKMAAFLGSIYAFFLLELLFSKHHDHSHEAEMESVFEVSQAESRPIKETNSNIPMNNIPRDSFNRSPSTASTSIASSLPSTSSFASINITQQLDELFKYVHVNNIQNETKKNFESSDVRDKQNATENKSKTVAWMIIVGDGIHNFADGLAIGAAFTVGISEALSTSITVLCHEIPHELGDFAVLMSTGMSIKRAMAFNLLSSLTAFAGLYIGLSIGDQEQASKWIFSIAAGMFLYVALADLIPECKGYYKTTPTKKMILFENIGLLSGYALMFLLAIFEDRLSI